MAILVDTCPPGTSHRKDASEPSHYQRRASGSLVGGGKQNENNHQQPIFANVEERISSLCDRFSALRMSSHDQEGAPDDMKKEFISSLCDRFPALRMSSHDQDDVPENVKNGQDPHYDAGMHPIFQNPGYPGAVIVDQYNKDLKFMSVKKELPFWLYEDYRRSDGMTADGYCDWLIELYLSMKKLFEQRTMYEYDEKNECMLWFYQLYLFLRSCNWNPSLKEYFESLCEQLPFLRNGDVDQCRLRVKVQMINWMYFIFLSSKNDSMNKIEYFNTVCHQFSTNFFSSDASEDSNTLLFTGNANIVHWVYRQFTSINDSLDQCFNWLFNQFPFLRSLNAEINACLTNRKCGLDNLMENCWFNALIQAVLPFINVTEELSFLASFSHAQKQICSVIKFLRLKKKPSKGMVKDAVLSVCHENKMRAGQQQDPAKFYQHCIPHLLEHSGNSPFITMCSEERCRVCDMSETDMIRDNICIKLDHTHTNASLDAHLKHKLSAISIDCRKCGTTAKSTIIKLPKVLVVQLLRGTENGKVTSAITPDVKLTLVDANAVKVDYILISAVAHEGASVRGHFVTYLFDNKGVLKFDDANVLRTESLKNLSKDGYIFFYVKAPYL